MLSPETLPGKLLLFLSALAMGLLVGSVTTMVHQNIVSIAGVEIPWGLALGLIAIAGFITGLRMLTSQRWLALVAGIGVVAMVFLLTQESPGGSVVVPNNVWGMVWAIAPTLLVLVIIAWPKLPGSARVAEPESVSGQVN